MKCTICLILIISAFAATAQKTGIELLTKMHERHKGAMCRYYTFSQKNQHYEEDTLIGQSVWHESVGLPDQFRIVFGDSAKGNMVLFRNDSVYRYRKAAVLQAKRDSNNLLLLLGGMYYRELPDVMARLRNAGYNIDQLSPRQWNKRKVFVIGAGPKDETSNQIWVDAEEYTIVRIIERMNAGDQMDMRFEKHQKWCAGFVEVKVSFRRNGSLEQVEEYYDLKERDKFW